MEALVPRSVSELTFKPPTRHRPEVSLCVRRVGVREIALQALLRRMLTAGEGSAQKVIESLERELALRASNCLEILGLPKEMADNMAGMLITHASQPAESLGAKSHTHRTALQI